MRLLDRVLDLLFPPRESELLIRDASDADVSALLAPALVPGSLTATALMRYDDPLARALIVETKFNGSERATKLLASLMRDYLLEWSAGRLDTLALVPLPLSRERLRERGYNQVERVVALAAAGLPLMILPDALERTRDTVPQTLLTGDERRRNMQGAFRAGTLDPKYTYIVVDDVTTTGASMLAAAEALKAAGARDIALLALAH